MSAARNFPVAEEGVEPFPLQAEFILMDVGISAYEATYAKQLKLVEQKKKDKLSTDYLIFVEHSDVYTYGRRSKEGPPPWLSPSFQVERGGEVTFHNLGQLVCYPLLTLSEGERDIHLHLRRLERVLIDVLKDFGLRGESRAGATGVWLVGKEKKIGSIGVAVSSWVTFHGSALNVNNDLSGFFKINPCGFSSRVMTSLEVELGAACPRLAEVKSSYLQHFTRHFNRLLKL
jgi:lipoyl(octanoyl) transferase